jgi:glycosyltransferase involved in cell wall biosynthesis
VDPATAPLVSVIIATWNRSEVLRHAVRSVLWQTYPNFELLVVGDGCTDDSEAVVAAFGDERVRWVNLPQNSGCQSTPNNEGLRLARGDYVAYLNHDDLYHPSHLSHLIPAIVRAGAYAGNTFMESIGPPGSNIRSLSGDEELGSGLSPTLLAHRREAAVEIAGWREPQDVRGPVDREFIRRLHAAGNRFVTVRALTVLKFAAAIREDCYLERSDAEQRAYVERIERERSFLLRELGAVALNRLRRRPPRYPAGYPGIAARDEDFEPAEFHNALRKVKGLPDLPPR